MVSKAQSPDEALLAYACHPPVVHDCAKSLLGAVDVAEVRQGLVSVRYLTKCLFVILWRKFWGRDSHCYLRVAAVEQDPTLVVVVEATVTPPFSSDLHRPYGQRSRLHPSQGVVDLIGGQQDLPSEEA